MSKKYVSLSRLSTFLDNLRTTFASAGHKHTTDDITDYTVDTELSSTSTNPVQNNVLDAEFNAVADALGALENAVDAKIDATALSDYYTKTETNDALDTLLETAKTDAANQDVVVLREAQTYIDTELTTAIEMAKTDAANKDIVVLVEAQTHTDEAFDTAKEYTDTALNTAKEYTDTKTADLVSTTTVDSKISTHNTSTTAHNDIRTSINNLTTSLNGKAASTHYHSASQITSGTLDSSRLPTVPITKGGTGATTAAAARTALGAAASADVYTKTEIDGKLSNLGGGDMSKSVYDTNNDGKVDIANDAEKLGGVAASEYALVGQLSDDETYNTIWGAKYYADDVVKTATLELIGDSSDSDPDNDTIYGAKYYADNAVATAKEELIGSDKDNTSSDTIHGAKYYAKYHAELLTDYLNSIKADKSTTLAGYGITDAYTKTEMESLELITVADIDAICGSSIQVASANDGSVTF